MVQKSNVGASKSNSFLNNLYRATSMGKTENDAVTFIRSGSELLDFFAQAGAMRNNQTEALNLFQKAFSEDRQSAVRILFYLRDIRGGQGERDLFRNCLEWLGTDYPVIFEKVISFVPEYGRWDDLFFDNETCYKIIASQLEIDGRSDTPSLIAKWLPTINASSPTTKAKAKFLANKIGMSDIKYRLTVRNIRKKIKTVEENMSSNKWNEIDYSTVTSQASKIYKNAFKEHDESRYSEFISKAEKGEVRINAGTLYPNQIYKSVQSDYSETLEALWNQLPDYTNGKNALVVADTSGSMSGDPMSVSVSLALYFAERNKGQFHNYFITFSETPKLIKVTGETLIEKYRCIETGEIENTNLQKVFSLILKTAVDNNTPENEIPNTIYIISDMEFDSAHDNKTNFEVIKEKYSEVGYKMPNLVFWNVNSMSGNNLPVQKNEDNVSLVSGFSPSIFKMVTEGKTPEQVMMDTINSPRYEQIIIN